MIRHVILDNGGVWKDVHDREKRPTGRDAVVVPGSGFWG